MDAQQLQKRTKDFSLAIIRLYKGLARTPEAQILGRQLLRSATSVAANYRAVCRARSNREFFAKICIVVEEADETVLWLELIKESGVADIETSILREANEILYIMAASLKTAKNNLNRSAQSPNQ
ncbi:four helix bundle protein [soil metagenome]